ncbi:hypothetical protein PC116_g33568, partial [Phytophthora cactorum]
FPVEKEKRIGKRDRVNTLRSPSSTATASITTAAPISRTGEQTAQIRQDGGAGPLQQDGQSGGGGVLGVDPIVAGVDPEELDGGPEHGQSGVGPDGDEGVEDDAPRLPVQVAEEPGGGLSVGEVGTPVGLPVLGKNAGEEERGLRDFFDPPYA